VTFWLLPVPYPTGWRGQGIIASSSGQCRREATVRARLLQARRRPWRGWPPPSPRAGCNQGSTHHSRHETQLCRHSEHQTHRLGAL